MSPKVSVIVPVFGVEKYIERCAVSLFEQTLQEIEFVFVDDCSPDNSIEKLQLILEKYPQRKKWTKIIRLSSNGGLPSARRRGLLEATGDYIIHCDSDDWVEIDMYEKLYTKAIEGNYDIVVCDFYTSYSISDRKTSQAIDNVSIDLLSALLNENVHGAVWNKLVSRSLYQNEIIFPKENLREDLTLIVQLVFYAKSVGYVTEPLYNYYINRTSITNTMLDPDRIRNSFRQAVRNYNIVKSFLDSHGKLEAYKDELLHMKLVIQLTCSMLVLIPSGFHEWNTALGTIHYSQVLKAKFPLSSKIFYLLLRLKMFRIAFYLKNLTTSIRKIGNSQ